MFKKLSKYLELQILLLLKEYEIRIKTCNGVDAKKQWDIETGSKFNELISKYAISEDELLSISETVSKFVTITRKTNIDKYLFVDDELEMPRRIL